MAMEIHSCWGSLDHGKYLCGGTCVMEQMQRLEDDSGVWSPLLSSCVHQACMVPFSHCTISPVQTFFSLWNSYHWKMLTCGFYQRDKTKKQQNPAFIYLLLLWAAKWQSSSSFTLIVSIVFCHKFSCHFLKTLHHIYIKNPVISYFCL